MNISDPDESQPAAPQPENAALRFLRWLLEPPVRPQSKEMRVVRWVVRAIASVVYAGFVGPDDGRGGMGGGRKNAKPDQRPS